MVDWALHMYVRGLRGRKRRETSEKGCWWWWKEATYTQYRSNVPPSRHQAVCRRCERLAETATKAWMTHLEDSIITQLSINLLCLGSTGE